MKTESYQISVIIPVYNVAEYLEKCIESVLIQKNVKYEIILVNDGSTDKSPDICNDYSEKYENICVIHKQNAGLGYARNSGLDIAKGEYIFFLDSDDWIVEGALEKLYFLAKNNDAEMVCFQYKMVSGRDYVHDELGEAEIECLDNEELMQRYVAGMSATAWSKFYRKNIFDEVRFTNVPIHEDAYSMHLFMEQVKKAVITKDIYYIQYIRKGSLTQSYFQEKNLLCIECGDRLIEFVKEKYPHLKMWAHINKIERQVYTINLLLRSPNFYKKIALYKQILQGLKKELEIVRLDKNLNIQVYGEGKKIVSYPQIYAIKIIIYTRLRRCIGSICELCGKS